MTRNGPRSIDDVLAAARARLRRLDPWATAGALAAGALLVDIRPVEVRRRDGEVAGALVVDRNVLEWRLDPGSPPVHHTRHTRPSILELVTQTVPHPDNEPAAL